MRVALTFDMESPGQAHWSPEAPGDILDALAEFEQKATFFVQGRWAQTEPLLVQRVVNEGHLLGMHSHFHAPWDRMTLDGLHQDIAQATEALLSLAGDPRPWARAPFGAVSPQAESVLGAHGYRAHRGWDVDPGDWMPKWSATDLVSRVLVNAKPGNVVLLHTWPRSTVQALPVLLQSLESVRLDEL